jgi:hypothetical protein
MELVRKQTYITRDQDHALKRIAHQEHATEAELMRRALDSWLKHWYGEDGDGEDPFAPLIGFADGPEKIDHNDIYDRVP